MGGSERNITWKIGPAISINFVTSKINNTNTQIMTVPIAHFPTSKPKVI